MPKVHNKPIKRPRKGFKQKGAKSAEVCPGLAHRTVRCATGQCPVHQGTPSSTHHLREFLEALHYNSSDCPMYHRTVSGAPGRSDSVLSSFGNLLRYNSPDCPVHTGLSGVPAEQRLLPRQRSPATAFNARQSAQKLGTREKAHRTAYRTCPVHHRTVRWSRRLQFQRSESNGSLTWLAHRTVRCAMRLQPSNGHFWWLGL